MKEIGYFVHSRNVSSRVNKDIRSVSLNHHMYLINDTYSR